MERGRERMERGRERMKRGRRERMEKDLKCTDGHNTRTELVAKRLGKSRARTASSPL